MRQKQNEVFPWLAFAKNTGPIWFHCASGEYEYAKPVIRELKSRSPKQKIMVTHFSPSIQKSLSQSSDIDFHCPMPWDKKKLWQQFIDHHQPKALLIARTDLWPMMLHTCKKKQVPCLLFSKTVNEKKSWLQKLFSRPFLQQLNDIFCVSEMDRQLLLKRLKPFKQIHAAGDTRYDQCLYRLSHPKRLKPLNNFKQPIFLAGSTWPKDEETLLPLVENFHKKMSFIIAPHEPTPKHLESLKSSLRKKEILFCEYSKTQNWNPFSVLIIDQVGILADLYAWSTMSFIGGSMNRSVHSVLESLAHGNLTFVGPKHYNNREALTFKKINIHGVQPVQSIQSSLELTQKVQTQLGQWSENHRLNLQLAVKNKSGATKIVLKWLEKNQHHWT